MFPKFSSKGRSKPVDPPPPPHNLHTRGKFELEIGPHIFSETMMYEAHYTTTQPSQTAHQPAMASHYAWKGGNYYTPYDHTPLAGSSSIVASTSGAQESGSSVTSLDATKSSSPFISSLTAVTTITPALISQVNTAASSNPILSNLLTLAAAGNATPDQLKTLGLLIQSLANPEPPVPASLEASSSAATRPLPTPTPTPTPTPPAGPPVKDFDLILEFQQSQSDKWRIPRSPALYRRTPSTTFGCFDIEMTVRVPFGTDAELIAKQDGPTPTKAVLHFKNAPFSVWDSLMRWSGGEVAMNGNRHRLERLESEPAFLGHRIPEGTLLTQLHSLSTPYSTKLIKPGLYASRAKRKPASRKPSTVGVTAEEDKPAAKRVRTNGKNGSATSQIQCEHCKKTDVPLMLGGRFCRPCINAGHGTSASLVAPIQPQPLPEFNTVTTSTPPTTVVTNLTREL
ncbi:hypothetical protein BDN72DRAFT_830496 [Pluteus cervinus]|uniref:Uncharacterized protein n=1 Tax=Pluteus cervinus TaxID=181527 RepID=A0ACD3BH13_9AGAR|nr:hypothetical protein BDN72DRAFT_830496 [Pluteus cervinus]